MDSSRPFDAKLANIEPNPLVCTNHVTCDWVHDQLDQLFTGVKSVRQRKDTRTRDETSYTSPMVLPASWHPKRSLEQLRANQYYVTEKYDGVRYFLLLVQHKHSPKAYMINRRGTIFPVSVTCRMEFFRGSLFEGELVFNSVTHKQEFHVFDIISLQGHHVHTIENGHLFGERIQWVRFIFDLVSNAANKDNQISCVGNLFALQFQPKLFYLVETYDPVFMVNKNIPNDGFVFTPNYNPIGPPQQDVPRIWKWKPQTTIDCWIYPSDPTIYLIYKREREPLKFVRIRGEVFVCRWVDDGTIPWSGEDRYKWHVVECLVVVRDREILFKPIRIRYDKTFPNSTKTFQLTLPTIVDPTPIDHVFSLLTLGPTQNAEKIQH